MSRQPPKGRQPPPDEDEEDHEEGEEEEEEDQDQEEGEGEDKDFDYDEPQGGKKKTQKVENLPFDEAEEALDESEVSEKDEPHKPVEKKANMGQKLAAKDTRKDEESDGEDQKGGEKELPGAYNPSDYDGLNVGAEVKELFKYIQRYKPLNIDLDTRLRVFIPDYIPAVGEVDAFLKIPRPDGQEENLGLTVLDEPTLNQSKRSKLDLIFKEKLKKVKGDSNKVVHSIENADKNPKEITAWIADVSDIQKRKQPPSVSYTKAMPEIDTLMQVWPSDFEDALAGLRIPSEDIDLDVEKYCRMACALLDIPVHATTNNKNVVESLHVFFTLYSEFKANQHFRQMNNQDQQGLNPSTPQDVQTMKF